MLLTLPEILPFNFRSSLFSRLHFLQFLLDYHVICVMVASRTFTSDTMIFFFKIVLFMTLVVDWAFNFEVILFADSSPDVILCG